MGELELLEKSSLQISHKLELEISKVIRQTSKNRSLNQTQYVQVFFFFFLHIVFSYLQIELFESKLTIYVEKIVNLTLLIGIMEKDPDSYTEVQIEEVKIQIKQIEALIVELQASIEISVTVLVSIRKEVKHTRCIVSSCVRCVCWYEITHQLLLPHIYVISTIIQIMSMIVILTRLETTYDKNLVLMTRREYIKLQQKLEKCERRHNEIFNPNIGKSAQHMDSIAVFVET